MESMDDYTIKVRVGGPEDEDDLLTLCRLWYGEEGIRDHAGLPLAFSAEKARAHIRSWLTPRDDDKIALCGIIGEPGAIEASICVEVTSPWCSQGQYLQEVWHYVHPSFRKEAHGRALVAFSMSVSDFLRATLMMGSSAIRNDAKERFMSRQGGFEPSGGVFVYQPGGTAL